ncbi:MAG: Hsp20/alpha crystallin family protein [bacterium]|nr:Hsp20/alpha crystallin family protein [bacterium]
MALIRWRPRDVWSPFADLPGDLSRVFDTSVGRLFGDPGAVVWSPALDIYEDKESIVVKADLPGMKEEDVDISIQGNTLTLRGERKQESEVKEKDFYRCERYYGSFQRCLELPFPVDQGKVKASYKGGVLEVRLPKAEEAKEKKIRIEVKE